MVSFFSISCYQLCDELEKKKKQQKANDIQTGWTLLELYINRKCICMITLLRSRKL